MRRRLAASHPEYLASDVDALDEVKLSGGQRGEMGLSAEVCRSLASGQHDESVLPSAREAPVIFELGTRTRAKRIPIRSMRPL